MQHCTIDNVDSTRCELLHWVYIPEKGVHAVVVFQGKPQAIHIDRIRIIETAKEDQK